MEEGFSIKPSKEEEILEIKALRRIIDAYLNYAEAAEVDVRRWEHSYSMLHPSHKALVSHLTEKYQQVRRCIAANSLFIFSMLQAFEPPFDMSQDILRYEELQLHSENVQHSRNNHGEEQQLACPCTEAINDVDILSQPKSYSSKKKSFLLHNAEIAVQNGDISSRENNVHNATEDSLLSTMSGSILVPINSNEPSDNHFSQKNCNRSSFDAEPVFEENSRAEVNNKNLNVSIKKEDEEHNCIVTDLRDSAFQLHVSPADIDKVRCIIRNIVRDWTKEGEAERRQCYEPILEELKKYFPERMEDRPPSCLVPGAGLGRLALEISRLGFVSQGNEFSYYMMICSNFILNHTHKEMEWVIYPWIHSNCNSRSDDDQLRPVYFPDLHPGSSGITEGFSMCAGDFVEVYSDPKQSGTWDAVVTCFFIDTAHNIVEYIEIIADILKEGGIWINLGPLLYHFADVYAPEEEMSIEISLEEVKKIAFHYGFEMEMERMIETTYTSNPASMMQNRYFAAFWTMKKKRSTSTNNMAGNKTG